MLVQRKYEAKLTKDRKAARTRNRYIQVPHLSQETKWKSNKITIKITNKSQELSPFRSGDHKAAMNRHEITTTTKKITKMITKEIPPWKGQ